MACFSKGSGAQHQPRESFSLLLAALLGLFAVEALPAPAGYDDAGDPAYDDGWQTGDNGGTGFGPWTIQSQTWMAFLSSSRKNGFASLPDIDTTGRSWVLFSEERPGDFEAVAYRAFDSPMVTGDTLRIAIDNGFIEPGAGKLVGINFRNGNYNAFAHDRTAGARLEFFFRGGETNCVVIDAAGERPTGIAYSDVGLHLAFTVLSNDAYRLDLTDQRDTGTTVTVEGTLKVPSEEPFGDAIESIALYNLETSEPGSDAHLQCFNKLSMNTPIPFNAYGVPTQEWESVYGAHVEQRNVSAFYAGGVSDPRTALADLDADGDLDMVMGVTFNQDQGLVQWFRNIGTATSPRWSRPEPVDLVLTNTTGEAASTRPLERPFPAPALGDVDADGDIDLVVGDKDGVITLIENAGSTEVPKWVERETPLVVDNPYAAPFLVDIDADGDLDLFSGWSGLSFVTWVAGLSFFENTGSSNTMTLAAASAETVPGDGPTFSLNRWTPCFADMDGDGDYDLLLGKEFFQRVDYLENTNSASSRSWAPPWEGWQAIYEPAPGPALADIDTDGDLDLLLGLQGEFQYRENTGTPNAPAFSFTPTTLLLSLLFDVGYGSSPALVDIDADGDLDLFAGEVGGNLNHLENVGSPTKASWGSIEQSYYIFDPAQIHPTFADIDGDGDLDLFVGYEGGDQDGTVTFAENIGSAQQAQWLPPVEDYGGMDVLCASRPAFADLDADGDFDAYIGNCGGSITFYENTGTASVAQWSTGAGHYSNLQVGVHSRPAFVDADLDGDLDLFVGEDSSFVGYFENLGTPSNDVWGPLALYQSENRFAAKLVPAFGDLDGDGDADWLTGNHDGGLTLQRNLHPKLNVAPVSATVAAEEEVHFSVTGSPVGVTWSLASNESNGTLHSGNGTYQAGTNAPALDIVEVISTQGIRGRAYVNVIDPDDLAAAGKAIIVAGGKSLDDPVWHATDFLGDKAYRVLRDRGLAKVSINYLSFEPGQDVDGDGLDNDISAATTLENVAAAFTNWASDASSLFVYLADHGSDSAGQGFFRLNASENLDGATLDGWLDHLQDTYGMDITVVMDFCYSGSFLDELTYTSGAAGNTGRDDAGDEAYDAGWSSGQNGGSGFGPWMLTLTSTTNPGVNGYFVGTSVSNGAGGGAGIDAQGRSWGVYAQAGNFTAAYRPLDGPLATNHAFQLSIDNGYIDAGQTVGFTLRHGNDTNGPASYNTNARFEFLFLGGSNNYLVVDQGGLRDTGIGYTDGGLDIVFSLLTNDYYTLHVTNRNTLQEHVLEGELSTDLAPAGSTLDSIALYNRNAGSGSSHDAFFNRLAIADRRVKRTVIASAADDELTYFIAGGSVSFSDAFFNALVQGFSVEEAFLLARDAMSTYQSAQLDDNGDGQYDRDIDGATARGIRPGVAVVAGQDIPQIGGIAPNQTINNGTSASLWADEVASVYPLERVWCSIIAPSHAPNTNAGIPVVDVPEVDLLFNPANGRYESTFNGFTEPGTYKINFLARDIWGSVSLPKQSFVTQAGFDERLLLVAGGWTNHPGWNAFNNMANGVYATARARQLGDEAIFYLNPMTNQDVDEEGDVDVDDLPSLAALEQAFTNWAPAADRLTVYLAGPATGNTFRLNETEFLDSATLDGWLDDYQGTNRSVNLVLDFDGSGAYVTNSLPPAGGERITIASTRPFRRSVREGEGLVSFSQYFASEIFAGKTIGDAADRARKTIRRASGPVRQRPFIDDNGNGIPNEKNVDGLVADQRYLGAAFVTGDDTPNLGQPMPTALLLGSNNLLVWVADVSDVDGISNVWTVITPPDYEGTGSLPRLDLAYSTNNLRYEAPYTAFDQPGAYTLTFYAMDTKGELSSAVQREVIRTDTYESDDTAAGASLYSGQPQLHTLHRSNDVDWVKFFAASNFAYDIETFQFDTNIDTVVRLYVEQTNGALSLVDEIDDFGFDEGELTGLDHPTSGWYYVEVSHFPSNGFGPGSYDLFIEIPVGGAPLLVIGGAVFPYSPLNAQGEVLASPLPAGSFARVDGGAPVYFNGQTHVLVEGLPGGTYPVSVEGLPAGYVPAEDPNLPGQVQNVNNPTFGNPRNKRVDHDPYGPWAQAVFIYEPLGRVTARVRDPWTGAWLEDVRVKWQAASGQYDGTVYTQYPFRATYGTTWKTDAQGHWPSNVHVLAKAWYDLILEAPGYEPFFAANALANTPINHFADFGTLYLTPTDANGNGIRDTWEDDFYGPGSNVVASEDTDMDTHTALDEYYLGTDPHSEFSGLFVEEAGPTNSTYLKWPVVQGRVYRVTAATEPGAPDWLQVGGPWTASVGQAHMEWTGTGPSLSNEVYRVELLVP